MLGGKLRKGSSHPIMLCLMGQADELGVRVQYDRKPLEHGKQAGDMA